MYPYLSQYKYLWSNTVIHGSTTSDGLSESTILTRCTTTFLIYIVGTNTHMKPIWWNCPVVLNANLTFLILQQNAQHPTGSFIYCVDVHSSFTRTACYDRDTLSNLLCYIYFHETIHYAYKDFAVIIVRCRVVSCRVVMDVTLTMNHPLNCIGCSMKCVGQYPLRPTSSAYSLWFYGNSWACVDFSGVSNEVTSPNTMNTPSAFPAQILSCFCQQCILRGHPQLDHGVWPPLIRECSWKDCIELPSRNPRNVWCSMQRLDDNGGVREIWRCPPPPPVMINMWDGKSNRTRISKQC